VKPIYPSLDSTRLGFSWLRQHLLGRKRLLDTPLAATYYAAGVTRLLTLDMGDFDIFGVFQPWFFLNGTQALPSFATSAQTSPPTDGFAPDGSHTRSSL